MMVSSVNNVRIRQIIVILCLNRMVFSQNYDFWMQFQDKGAAKNDYGFWEQFEEDSGSFKEEGGTNVRITDIPYGADCIENLNIADANKDDQLDAVEYLTFIQLQSECPPGTRIRYRPIGPSKKLATYVYMQHSCMKVLNNNNLSKIT